MTQNNIHATIKTSKGDIDLILFYEKVPITVTNFITLADRGFYDGLNFHRVIEDFMIQTGCPMGTGTGGPGYQFEDEFDPSLFHDSAGILSMANSGPDTNGSQFFITHTPTPWLDGVHSIFGRTADQDSQDVVNKIEQGDIIRSITVNKDMIVLSPQMQGFSDQINKFLDQSN